MPNLVTKTFLIRSCAELWSENSFTTIKQLYYIKAKDFGFSLNVSCNFDQKLLLFFQILHILKVAIPKHLYHDKLDQG